MTVSELSVSELSCDSLPGVIHQVSLPANSRKDDLDQVAPTLPELGIFYNVDLLVASENSFNGCFLRGYQRFEWNPDLDEE